MVNGMTKYKIQIRLSVLALTLFLSNSSIAVELLNDNKDNGTSNTVSHADLTGDANGNIGNNVNTSSYTSKSQQQQFISNTQSFQQMEIRRRQMQEAQIQAYKQYLQRRKQQLSSDNTLPPEVQARREQYIEHMKKRRELIDKMLDERRKAVQERRQAALHKMHQTSTTSATAGKT